MSSEGKESGYLSKVGVFDRAVFVLVGPFSESLLLSLYLLSLCHDVDFLIDGIVVSLM